MNEFTVLSDYAQEGQSHRELAEVLITELREEMPDDEFRIDFTTDLQEAVIDAILRDLQANLKTEDWYGMGFEDPEDFLNAEDVSEAIGTTAEWYFEDDQIGKSADILNVILDYAEEYEIIQR